LLRHTSSAGLIVNEMNVDNLSISEHIRAFFRVVRFAPVGIVRRLIRSRLKSSENVPHVNVSITGQTSVPFAIIVVYLERILHKKRIRIFPKNEIANARVLKMKEMNTCLE
jgi:hypothetical protein